MSQTRCYGRASSFSDKTTVYFYINAALFSSLNDAHMLFLIFSSILIYPTFMCFYKFIYIRIFSTLSYTVFPFIIVDGNRVKKAIFGPTEIVPILLLDFLITGLSRATFILLNFFVIYYFFFIYLR